MTSRISRSLKFALPNISSCFYYFSLCTNFLSSRRRSFNWFCCWNQFLTPKVSFTTGMGWETARRSAFHEKHRRAAVSSSGLSVGLGKRLLIESFSAVAIECWFRLTHNQSAGRTSCAACGSIKRALRRSTNEAKWRTKRHNEKRNDNLIKNVIFALLTFLMSSVFWWQESRKKLSFLLLQDEKRLRKQRYRSPRLAMRWDGENNYVFIALL